MSLQNKVSLLDVMQFEISSVVASMRLGRYAQAKKTPTKSAEDVETAIRNAFWPK